MRCMTILSTALFLATAFFLAGCSSEPQPAGGGAATAGGAAAEHAEKAPHGGFLIELGHEHKHHAELVHDDATTSVIVYILDGDLKDQPIAEPSLSMTLTAGGETKTHELAAADAVDGKTAKFTAGRDVFDALEEFEADKNASGKLRVTIDGTPYSGDVKMEPHTHNK